MSIRKLGLLAAACVAAAAVVPVTPASAAAVVGMTCKIEGTASFTKTLKPGVLQNMGYTFQSEKVEPGEPIVRPGFPVGGLGVECEVTVTKAKLKGEAKITGGKAEIACGGAAGVEVGAQNKEGDVTLLLSESGAAPFKEFGGDLAFGAVGGSVAVVIRGDEPTAVASGEANFVEPGSTKAKKETVEKCANSEIKALPFYATVAGTIEEAS